MSNSLIPKIPEGQFALIQCEVRTGIVLGLDGKRYLGQGERILVFNSLSFATEKAKEIIRSNPEIECSIQDDRNQNVATLRDENHVNCILENARKLGEEKNKWWKFW